MSKRFSPTVTVESGSLCVQTPYDAGFVETIKTLPTADRKFDKERKAWLVDPRHAQAIADMIFRAYGERVAVPEFRVELKTVTLELRYVGATKIRGNGAGDPTAFGFANGDWTVVLPERVMRVWFREPVAPDAAATFYDVLGVDPNAAPETVKTAYRRRALQWHPDVCDEPDAKAQFQRIQHAFETLADPVRKKAYDLRLAREARRKHPAVQVVETPAANGIEPRGYRSPLRCGVLLVEAVESVGRWRVEKILSWDDIKNEKGETLVSSWMPGAKTHTEKWVAPDEG